MSTVDNIGLNKNPEALDALINGFATKCRVYLGLSFQGLDVMLSYHSMPSPLKRKIRLKRNHELPLFILTTANQPLLICYKETCIASMSLPTSQFQQHHLNHQEARGPAMPLRLRDNKCMSFLRENLLTLLTIIGVLAGTLLGWGLRATGVEWSRRDVMYFQYPGELFLRMLKCLIVPLLVSSIVSAIGSLDLSLSGK